LHVWSSNARRIAQSSTRHRKPRLGLFQAAIARPMCARIQSIQFSDEPPAPLPRPHSNGSGCHHRAPAFKRSCRALNHAEAPRPHSSRDFIAPRTFKNSGPPSAAPSITPIQAPSIKQSGRPRQHRPAAVAPSFKPFRSQAASPWRPHSSGVGCGKSPKHYLGKWPSFWHPGLSQVAVLDFILGCSGWRRVWCFAFGCRSGWVVWRIRLFWVGSGWVVFGLATGWV
jgi:hypothetical protein